MAALNMESKAWRYEWSTEGEQRRRWRTLGAPKDDLNKINASWELTASSLSTALARSAQRSDHALSNTGPGNRGAPRSVIIIKTIIKLLQPFNGLFSRTTWVLRIIKKLEAKNKYHWWLEVRVFVREAEGVHYCYCYYH